MDNIIRLSLYLTPIVLITGPALTDITITIASITFVFKSIKKKLFYYYSHPLCVFFWVWCFYLIINSLISENK